MQRRTMITAAFGFGAFAGLASLDALAGARPRLDPALAHLDFFSRSCLAFGTTITVSVLESDAQRAEAAIHAALAEAQAVDALMSLRRADSQVFRLNRDRLLRQPDARLRYILDFSRKLSHVTGGAFDITVQPLWQTFRRAADGNQLPDAAEIAAARALVDWRRVESGAADVRLQSPGMAITLNGIAQGYAVDLAIAALQARGVRHALLDTGEFGALGARQDHRPWTLGIGHPRRPGEIIARLQLDGRRIATSGDYATYFTPDFAHHHIFDPATGDSPPELASVTVAAPSGILADGLSTAFVAMGSAQALALCALWPDVDALLVRKDGAVFKTARFPAAAA